jgi:hypothetical protein
MTSPEDTLGLDPTIALEPEPERECEVVPAAVVGAGSVTFPPPPLPSPARLARNASFISRKRTSTSAARVNIGASLPRTPSGCSGDLVLASGLDVRARVDGIGGKDELDPDPDPDADGEEGWETWMDPLAVVVVGEEEAGSETSEIRLALVPCPEVVGTVVLCCKVGSCVIVSSRSCPGECTDDNEDPLL